MTKLTLAELDRLAEPLHARVVTKEGLETTLRLTYEAGRESLNPSRVRTVLESVLLGRRFAGGLSESVIDEVLDRLAKVQEDE